MQQEIGIDFDGIEDVKAKRRGPVLQGGKKSRMAESLKRYLALTMGEGAVKERLWGGGAQKNLVFGHVNIAQTPSAPSFKSHTNYIY